MPASKKDLRKQEQKKNQAAGVGDAKGRMPSRVKVKERLRMSFSYQDQCLKTSGIVSENSWQ